jgi:hypothetical protein
MSFPPRSIGRAWRGRARFFRRHRVKVSVGPRPRVRREGRAPWALPGRTRGGGRAGRRTRAANPSVYGVVGLVFVKEKRDGSSSMTGQSCHNLDARLAESPRPRARSGRHLVAASCSSARRSDRQASGAVGYATHHFSSAKAVPPAPLPRRFRGGRPLSIRSSARRSQARRKASPFPTRSRFRAALGVDEAPRAA